MLVWGPKGTYPTLNTDCIREMCKLMVNEIFWEMYHLVYIFYFIKKYSLPREKYTICQMQSL